VEEKRVVNAKKATTNPNQPSSFDILCSIFDIQKKG